MAGAVGTTADRVMDVFRFFRMEFWVVSVFPAWVGWCVATRQMVPDLEGILAATDGLLSLDEVVGYGIEHWRAILALVTLGPFLGGAIMVTNDYFDREVDVFNPKKAKSPLVRGTATPARARFWMVTLCLATLAGGLILDVRFALLLALGLAMSFAYSAPPLRLKARPLGDVLVNAVGYGAVATLAGWGLGSGWSGPVPVGTVLIVALAITAGYLPTVMMDHATDRATGLRTTAVTYGLHATWILGLQALVAANVTMVALALAGLYVTPDFAAYVLPSFLIEVAAYVVLVRSDEPQRMFLGGIIVTMAFFGNLVAFLLFYTGML